MYNRLKKYLSFRYQKDKALLTIADSNIPDVDVEVDIPFSVDAITEKIGAADKDITAIAQRTMSVLANEMEVSQGVCFISDKDDNKQILRFLCGYAYEKNPDEVPVIDFGEGFPGQVAGDGKPMIISEVPEGLLSIVSGLGKSSPASIIIFPVIAGKEVIAVFELASFHRFTEKEESALMEISSYIAPLMKKAKQKK